ncbi:hypothetical protein [uncultured Tateyamaria sp.]|nr:hypothetical protein [uncultured Tateyamaria sp.]
MGLTPLNKASGGKEQT